MNDCKRRENRVKRSNEFTLKKKEGHERSVRERGKRKERQVCEGETMLVKVRRQPRRRAVVE